MPYHIGRRTLGHLLLSVGLLSSTQGCLATRDWVTAQLNPLAGRVSAVEARLNQTDAKVDNALDRLGHLRLERQFVLNLREGATFASNSAALTPEAKRQIEGFLSDLPEPQAAIFLVAGHTDRSGPVEYNYELGQKRATSVAQYLIVQKGLDPLRVSAVSYGATAPLADNTTPEGRRQNRRVEILVYREVITSAAVPPRAEVRGPEGR